MRQSENCWVIIPAAGSGKRFGSEKPKQYLTIGFKTVLEHSLNAFMALPEITGIIVVTADADPYWPQIQLATHKPIDQIIGGEERCHSVYNGLNHLLTRSTKIDWVMVHDAARPCVTSQDIKLLYSECQKSRRSGILASPVTDTLKRSGIDQQIQQTVDRQELWRALTPQMFPFDELYRSLKSCIEQQRIVTDDAQALEHRGVEVRIIEGRSDNIKVTHAEDFPLAEIILKRQERYHEN